MCGICGFSGNKDEALLEKMCNCLMHRGPDSSGRYTDENISLGIRRLDVIDLETGDQPIYNENRTMVIIFNGEIYNYRELKRDLEKKGHHFYTKTDTEVIIHLYEDYKDECVGFLNGMFAFALWDKHQNKLFIARDRIGEKPLYYTLQNGKLLFASELKALLEDTSIARRISLDALDYYLRFLYIPAPLTIFRDIHKLAPAHILIWQNNRIEIKRYWELKIEPGNNLSEEDYVERVKGLLKESVRLRLSSDVPLGVFLSGGIDSSIIVAMMRQVNSSEIKTFSIGFEKKYSAYNELAYSRLIKNYFKTDHQEYIVNPEVIKLLPKIVRHLDEPFADSSAILTYLISQQARRTVTVALSGVGGDELFGGYHRYIGARLSLEYQKLPYFFRKGLSFVGAKDSRGRMKRFLQNGVLSEEARYINWLSVFTDDIIKNVYTDDIKNERKGKSQGIFKSHFNRVISAGYLDRIFYLDVNTYLVDDLLFMGDRMSMSCGLELRSPFCDHKFVELSASIPFALKIKGYNLKSLLKKAVKDILPKQILYKKKQGFMAPIGEWFRTELKDFIRGALSEETIKKRRYFNPVFVNRMLHEHFEGKTTYTHQIWALLMFELWYREFMDNQNER